LFSPTDFEDLLSEGDATAPAAQLTTDQYKEALSHALEELQIMKYDGKNSLALQPLRSGHLYPDFVGQFEKLILIMCAI